jgi:CheY-like chemotaxis protein
MVPQLVLVVDDDFLVRTYMAETLGEAGFHVVEARDAATALAVLQDNPCVQLLCTDVQMPGELDGIDLAIRVRETHRHIKVIVVSGCGKKENLPPNVPFLAKPFLSSRLIDLARKQLSALHEREAAG